MQYDWLMAIARLLVCYLYCHCETDEGHLPNQLYLVDLICFLCIKQDVKLYSLICPFVQLNKCYILFPA